jgi:hypothetical protein
VKLAVPTLGPTAGQRRLRPHERVVVIAEDPTSGATIGYYGTIVRLHTSSLRLNPGSPAQWTYSVFVQRLQKCVDVVATSLFATGQISNVDIPAEIDESNLVVEIRFHHSLVQGNPEVHGAYRLPEAEWRLFSFRKSEVARASFRLAVPVPDESSRAAELEFSVPFEHELDKHYVFRAIAEVHSIVQAEK